MEVEETSESSQKSMKGEARIGRPSDVVKNATCRRECNKFLTFANEEENRGFYLDLNAEDTSSSIKNDNTFYHFDNFEHVKSRDDLACKNDSVRVWEGLKRNNYMSAPRGVVPVPVPVPVPMPIKVPKARGRKKCNDVMMKKKKKELGFAKVAAPSGLLNELNPGIINHVRNSKQVYSIIKAVVRSETTEKNTLDVHTSSRMEEKNLTNKDDHDELELKLSSSHTVASENASCLSNEESGNLTSVTSLSSKAANIASQWLELVNQDINGRLAALRQSKKRVRTVITKELPLLTSKELSSNKASANAHADRWSTIFEQMEKSLSEEETILENWLNQVNNMQLHCERGLSNSLYTISEGTDRMGNNGLWEAHISDKDLAVRAAAASIYSTCNFLLTMGNQPCC
ncbi:hypothetical protein ACS0TY_011151 [Phlomoides rotata]